MGALAAFPNCPLVSDQTRGRSVVVAPRGLHFVAWVETERGWSILEDTPSSDHAFYDGFAYAARHDLPFRFQTYPHDTGGRQPQCEHGGTVYLTPSERHGGSWDVAHVSASGDSTAVLANRFNYREALTAARDLARDIGARLERNPPMPSARASDQRHEDGGRRR